MSESSECRICGNAIRDGEDVIVVDGDRLHHECVDAPITTKRRKTGMWASMGRPNQTTMGEVQREL
jgi:hypothetical protein